MEKITLTSILGNEFEMEGSNYNDYISTMAAGYIIRPDGKCVVIPDGCDHADISSNYIQKYLEKSYIFYQSTEAIQVLTNEPFNCVVYNGLRPQDIKSIYAPKISQSYTEGYGIIFLPINTEMTLEQKLACNELINSNKSIFGEGEKLPLTFGYITGQEISREEFDKEIIIEENQKTK